MKWYSNVLKQRRMEKQRMIRLRTKAQKAKAIKNLDEILEERTWNRRFGSVQRMRSERAS